MNLLLLDPDEVDPHGEARLVGRRLAHLREVLRAAPGRELRAGILGGPAGRAEVLAIDEASATLRLDLDPAAEPAPRDRLLLALPRPKVLRRVLEDAAALGFGRIALVRSWRVDKSHLAASATDAGEIEAHLRRGLEQGRRTHLPEVRRFDLFRPFVEDRLEGWAGATARFLAEPGATFAPLATPPADEAGITLAIGPERGWIPYELEALAARGFRPLSLGPHPLRVEAALAAAWGALQASRARGTPSPINPAASASDPLRREP